MHTLSTPRFVLEPQQAAHAEEMFRVLGDPAIYEFENEPPASVEKLRERYAKLETRRSADGRHHWLNWVIRLPSRELAGFVQATVDQEGHAAIAYVLGSEHWGRGLAREAVEAMIRELADQYGVRHLFAVLKRANHRSRRLLERLGFFETQPAPDQPIDPDEILMMLSVERAAG